MGTQVKNPKVVVSDTPPPVVQCRDGKEVAACKEVVSALRRGYEPMAMIFRTQSGKIEVHARSAVFTSVGHVVDVMKMATIKLTYALFRVKGTLAG